MVNQDVKVQKAPWNWVHIQVLGISRFIWWGLRLHPPAKLPDGVEHSLLEPDVVVRPGLEVDLLKSVHDDVVHASLHLSLSLLSQQVLNHLTETRYTMSEFAITQVWTVFQLYNSRSAVRQLGVVKSYPPWVMFHCSNYGVFGATVCLCSYRLWINLFLVCYLTFSLCGVRHSLTLNIFT